MLIRAENSSGTGEFPAQMASNAENASIWWRHHVLRAMIHPVAASAVYRLIKCVLSDIPAATA